MLFSPRQSRRNSRTVTNQSHSKRGRSTRLSLESLEDRAVPASVATAAAAYGQLPLAFTANDGQAVAGTNFIAEGGGYTMSLTSGGADLALQNGSAQDNVQLQLVGSNPSASASGLDELITKSNYLIGNNPAQWHTNIANYGQVEYQNVYPGVNLVYYGNQGQLEYDFDVAPGANPNAIQLSIQGAQGLLIDAQGNLVIKTSGPNIVEDAPVVYQTIAGVRHSVAGQFVLMGDQVGFKLGSYDHSQPLVIDPTLSYSTYLNLNLCGNAIAVDSAGNAYVTGANGAQVFVEKLNATGTALVYSTFLGTQGGQGAAIAVDQAGDAYLLANANGHTGYPTTANAPYSSGVTTMGTNSVFSVLNPSGSGLIYSTYLPYVQTYFVPWGFTGGIAVDTSGNAYIAASAFTGFNTTANAFQSTCTAAQYFTNAAFLKIDPYLSGSSSILYATFLGGTGFEDGTGIAISSSGNAYITGETVSTDFPTTPGAFQTTYNGPVPYNSAPQPWGDAYVAEIDPNLSGSASLIYATYLGTQDGVIQGGSQTGNAWAEWRYGPAIAVDSSGDAYVTGATGSTTFPTTSGAFQTAAPTPLAGGSSSNYENAFVSKLNPSGSALIYSTYLGGNDQDIATSIAIDSNGNAYVTGLTRSTNFPIKNPIQSKKADKGTGRDVFVSVLNGAGSGLLFSTYFGSTANDYANGLALDSAGNIYVTGYTQGVWPTTKGVLQPTASFPAPGCGFVFKISSSFGGGAPLLRVGGGSKGNSSPGATNLNELLGIETLGNSGGAAKPANDSIVQTPPKNLTDTDSEQLPLLWAVDVK